MHNDVFLLLFVAFLRLTVAQFPPRVSSPPKAETHPDRIHFAQINTGNIGSKRGFICGQTHRFAINPIEIFGTASYSGIEAEMLRIFGGGIRRDAKIPPDFLIPRETRRLWILSLRDFAPVSNVRMHQKSTPALAAMGLVVESDHEWAT